MKAVASRVTEKSDVLLLQAVDMEDSGPYEIAEPRVITALETYTPSCKSRCEPALSLYRERRTNNLCAHIQGYKHLA
jgi:myosin-5